MPQSARHTPSAEVPSVTSYGQVIEYIQGNSSPPSSTITSGRSLMESIANMYLLQYTDRLYLASYTHAPDENTPFPYPSKPARSPTKRSSKAQSGPQAVVNDGPKIPPYYFCVDRSLLYNAFHADFGPLHIGHLYRFAVQLHDVLGHPENESRPVVFWSNADSRSECLVLTHQPRQPSHAVSDFIPRSRQCCMHISDIHGSDPELATSPCTCADCANGPTMHAFPRRRIQPGRLFFDDPRRCVRRVESEGRKPRWT